MGSVHAFWPEQLSIQVDGESQLERLKRLGLFAEPIPTKTPPPSPHDVTESLESRARSYLGLNCATCHRNLGGGTANFNFDLTKTLEENNYIGEPPAQGSFGLNGASVVAAGDPLRSVLVYRMLKSGRGHMPQFGSNVIDLDGVQLLRDWIESIPPPADASLNQSKPVQPRISELVHSDSKVDQTPLIEGLMSSTAGAVALSLACSEEAIDAGLKKLIVGRGNAHQQPEIRDLFEHYLLEDQRVKRLGPTIDADALLAMEGSVDRGRHLFEIAKDVNCRACHRIGEVGQNVGPDLSGIAVKQKPKEILASILNPSEKIDEKFRAQKILTVDGKAISGIIVREDADELTIVDTTGKELKLAVDDIELMQPSTKSAMPDQLLSGMTAQQAADLLAFLSAQTKPEPLIQPQERN